MEESHLSLSDDKPINDPKEDILNRARFSNSIADAISNWKGEESLVIAVFGEWGSGKSSIKNLAVKKLSEETSSKTWILEFNPWQLSSTEKLNETFFNEIKKALNKTGDKEAKKVAKKISQWASNLNIGKSFFDIYKTLNKIIIGGAALSIATQWVIPAPLSSLKPYLLVIAFVLMILSFTLEWLHNLLKNTSNTLLDRINDNKKGLSELKEELSNDLRDLDNSLLIVMDDIDRLNRDEMKQLFQLVKMNADFPNIIYFMLFQRDIVEQCLGEITSDGNGSKYLDKIVQVGLQIPHLPQIEIEKLLLNQFDGFLTKYELGGTFDQVRWHHVVNTGILKYFDTIRTVKRFCNKLEFHLSHFSGLGQGEINTIDAIVLEVLQEFEPEVYKQIPHLYLKVQQITKTIFSGSDKSNEKIEQELANVLELSRNSDRYRVKGILIELFPQLSQDNSGKLGDKEFDSLKQSRVCHPNVFEKYFSFEIPFGKLSYSETVNMIASTSDEKEFSEILFNYKDKNLIEEAIEHLVAYEDEIDTVNAIPLITSLYNIGDYLPEAPIGINSIPGYYRIRLSGIIHRHLKRIRDHTQRFNIMEKCIIASNGLYFPIHDVAMENTIKERESKPDDYVLEKEDAEKLIDVCLEKIRQAIENNTLQANSELDAILHRWAEWASESDVSKWLLGVMDNPEGVQQVMMAFMDSGVSYGDKVTKHWNFNLKNLERFISVDQIELGICSLSNELLEKQPMLQRAINLYSHELKMRDEGKPTD